MYYFVKTNHDRSIAPDFWLRHCAVPCAAADCEVNGPLGMITGEVQDWQISASSTYPQDWDRACHERYARVYQPNGVAWCAKHKSASEWIQVDLGLAAKVSDRAGLDLTAKVSVRAQGRPWTRRQGQR